MVACMNGWIEQWYVYVPGCGNVVVKLAPGAISPESQAPSVLVLVCATGSLLVNVIAWPGLTVIVVGANANLPMLTLAAPAAGTLAAADTGWTTIFRGALPTGTGAVTLCSARSTTDTSFEFSLVTYAHRLSGVTPIQCGIVPTL